MALLLSYQPLNQLFLKKKEQQALAFQLSELVQRRLHYVTIFRTRDTCSTCALIARELDTRICHAAVPSARSVANPHGTQSLGYEYKAKSPPNLEMCRLFHRLFLFGALAGHYPNIRRQTKAWTPSASARVSKRFGKLMEQPAREMACKLQSDLLF